MKKISPAFTLLELILVLSVFVFLASLLFAFLSNAWEDAQSGVSEETQESPYDTFGPAEEPR